MKVDQCKNKVSIYPNQKSKPIASKSIKVQSLFLPLSN